MCFLFVAFFGFLYFQISATFKFSNELGRNVIVMSAPSFYDAYYKEKFFDIVHFQLDLAKIFMRTDNVILLADRNTMPYLQGRSHQMPGKKLADDILLEANVYDVFIRDFAPMGLREVVKFRYEPKSMDEFAARQIDKSMMRFLTTNDFKWAKNASLTLSGSQVVDNGKDRAIIDKLVYADNRANWQEWALTIQLMSTFKQIGLIDWLNNTGPLNDSLPIRLDDWMAFIDADMLAVSAMSPENHQLFEDTIRRAFKGQVKLVEMPDLFAPESWNNHTGVCGLYTTLLSTENFIYVPVFGNDPDNWLMGQSTMMDKMAVEMIQVNTKKTVIPINMPRKMCQIGASLRSLTWLAKGDMADRLIKLARKRKVANPADPSDIVDSKL